MEWIPNGLLPLLLPLQVQLRQRGGCAGCCRAVRERSLQRPLVDVPLAEVTEAEDGEEEREC